MAAKEYLNVTVAKNITIQCTMKYDVKEIIKEIYEFNKERWLKEQGEE